MALSWFFLKALQAGGTAALQGITPHTKPRRRGIQQILNKKGNDAPVPVLEQGYPLHPQLHLGYLCLLRHPCEGS